MGSRRQNEHHLGYGMSEGAQRIKRHAISCGGANIFQSGADVLERTDRTEEKPKGRKREES